MILYQCKSYSGGFNVSEWSFIDQPALQCLVFYLYTNIHFRYTFIYKYKQKQFPISHQHALNFNQSLQGNRRLWIEKTSSVHSFSELYSYLGILYFLPFSLSIQTLPGFTLEQTLDQKPTTSKTSQKHLTSCESCILKWFTCQYKVMSREKQTVW